MPVVGRLDRPLELIAQLDQPAFAAVAGIHADADGEHTELRPPIEQLLDRQPRRECGGAGLHGRQAIRVELAQRRLELEDLRHEARLVHAGRAGEADHAAAGGSLDRGAEARPNRVLVLGAHLDHRVLLAVLDQEFLVRQQFEVVENDGHVVLRDTA